MTLNKRVAIIGAGPLGLSAIKSCKEVGFEPVCFEKSDDIGGLWKYRDNIVEGSASVMKNTIMNSSKEMSAYSDFPPPKEFPVFLHNTQMYQYLRMYAEHFDLMKYARYKREVFKVEPTKDHETTGRWTVYVRDLKANEVATEEFDAVMVCIGHHIFPKFPSFPGKEKFTGVIIHSHSLKNCEELMDKRVLVVGLGSSAADVAVESTLFAQKVYVSTRSGAWIFSRLGIRGRPYDMDYNSRRKTLMGYIMPFTYVCDRLENKLNKNFDHEGYSVKPKNRVLCSHPTVNDHLPSCILSGRVVVKRNIERLETNGVLFAGDKEITEIDVIILATGYIIKFPFLGDIVPVKENKVDLYKFMISPILKHPTLAIIGLFQPIGGPFYTVGEMQSRWFCQLVLGNIMLPSTTDMLKYINARHLAIAKRYTDSTRHTIQCEWIPYMDELASEFGVKPNILKMALTDPKLFVACFNGPCLPYQYRLQGTYAWPGARSAILKYEKRIFFPLNAEGKVILKNEDNILKKTGFLIFILIYVIFFWASYGL